MEPDPYIQFLENWIPGIGEDTKLHDQLHEHFGLGFSVNDEARLLGFQLGHHPAGNFFHVIVFSIMSLTIYPDDYRNTWEDVQDFYSAYLLGKYWQSVSYWFIPKTIMESSGKKDYDGPLYAPWSKVVAGKKKFIEWLKKQEKNES